MTWRIDSPPRTLEATHGRRADPQPLRDITEHDATTIAAIYNESIASGSATTDQEPKNAEEIREWIRGFSKRETILLLEQGSEPVGWGVIKRYSDRSGYRFTCETSVYLRHQYLGQGYGTYIKRALISRCRKYGYHHLVVKILAENKRALEYNRRLGYEMVGIQKEVAYKDGRWQDVAILQLVLEKVPPEIPERYAEVRGARLSHAPPRRPRHAGRVELLFEGRQVGLDDLAQRLAHPGEPLLRQLEACDGGSASDRRSTGWCRSAPPAGGAGSTVSAARPLRPIWGLPPSSTLRSASRFSSSRAVSPRAASAVERRSAAWMRSRRSLVSWIVARAAREGALGLAELAQETGQLGRRDPFEGHLTARQGHDLEGPALRRARSPPRRPAWPF